MWTLLHRRSDGSFVIECNGHPYHVTLDDPLFPEVADAADGAELPPEPMPPAGPVYSDPPTLADYQGAIQRHIDATAGERGYDNAASCAGYVNSTVLAWAAEAAAFVAWRDAVWIAVFDRMAEVQAGAPPPSIAGLIAGLPAIEWPA